MFNSTKQVQDGSHQEAPVNYEKALADFSQYSIKAIDIKALSDKVVNMIAKSINIDFCNILKHVPEKQLFYHEIWYGMEWRCC